MSAYLISTYREIHDEAKRAAYAELAGPALIAGGGVFLARDVAAAAYESGVLQRTVLVEFADVETAQAAYDSAAYQEALAALGDGVDRDLRIVPGLTQG